MNELKVIEQREVLGRQFKMYGNYDNPLFLAKDVADWIEHSNVSAMLQSVGEDEKVISNVYTLGGMQEARFLTEDGLYEVLMLSRKPIAKEFKKQVKEILKSVRKRGIYATDITIDKIIADPEFGITLLNELKQERQRAALLTQKNETLKEELDKSKQWFTVKRVAAINNVHFKQICWKSLKQQSAIVGKQVLKIFDANFGKVNLYHVDVWKRVYPNFEYPIEYAEI